MCVFYILSLNMNIQQDLRSEVENKQPYHCSAIQPASAVIGEWRYYIRNILSYYPEPGQCGRRFIFYNFISADINKERLNTQLSSFPVAFAAVHIKQDMEQNTETVLKVTHRAHMFLI